MFVQDRVYVGRGWRRLTFAYELLHLWVQRQHWHTAKVAENVVCRARTTASRSMTFSSRMVNGTIVSSVGECIHVRGEGGDVLRRCTARAYRRTAWRWPPTQYEETRGVRRADASQSIKTNDKTSHYVPLDYSSKVTWSKCPFSTNFK